MSGLTKIYRGSSKAATRSSSTSSCSSLTSKQNSMVASIPSHGSSSSQDNMHKAGGSRSARTAVELLTTKRSSWGKERAQSAVRKDVLANSDMHIDVYSCNGECHCFTWLTDAELVVFRSEDGVAWLQTWLSSLLADEGELQQTREDEFLV